MLERIIAMVENLGNDAVYWLDNDEEENKKNLHVSLNDFEGFDENWSEIFRKFDNKNAIEDVQNWLEENCDAFEECFTSTYYYFDDFIVHWFYKSGDL